MLRSERMNDDFIFQEKKISIQLGNPLYILTILILFFIIFFSLKLCHKKGKQFSYRFILGILIFNFLLHFAKQLFPPYMKQFPSSLWKSTFENLCATLIIISPFIFVSKNKYLKDYMYYIGVISGIGVYFFPFGTFGRDLTNMDVLIDVIRFYVCHIPLVLCGFLMVEEGFHKLDYRRLWSIPITYLTLQCVIFTNDVVKFACGGYANECGYIDSKEAWMVFLYRNGPANESTNMGFKENFDSFLSWLYIPYLMTYKMDGRTYFIPVLWAYLPILSLSYPVGTVLAYPFQKEQMKIDYRRFLIKMRYRIKK